MNDQNYLHIALIYLAVIRSSLLALLAMNVVTFFMYGIDKWFGVPAIIIVQLLLIAYYLYEQ